MGEADQQRVVAPEVRLLPGEPILVVVSLPIYRSGEALFRPTRKRNLSEEAIPSCVDLQAVNTGPKVGNLDLRAAVLLNHVAALMRTQVTQDCI